jgi:hypothetical protein
MNWKNVHRDQLPEHDEEVLLSMKGVYYLTTFDGNQNVFRLKEEPESFFEITIGVPMYYISISDRG